MRIVMLGDSITDMNRNRNEDFMIYSYGAGYPFFIEGELALNYPKQFEVINRGVCCDRIVDVYARIKKDLWNLNPDIVSVLIGTNDAWHDVASCNGVEIDRFERIYDMFIKDTKKALPNAKFVLMEPFVLHGNLTEQAAASYTLIRENAKIVKKLAEENNCCFVPLQKILDDYAEKLGPEFALFDGIHPSVAGAKIIADEWLKCFKEYMKI